MSDNFNTLIKKVLADKKAPSPDLNRQIIAKAKENNQMKNNKIKKSAVAAACICLAAASSITAYAAYRYLSPSQVAEEVSESGALAKAFESDDAVLVNETQSTNGYDITLLGLVSGKNLELCVPQEAALELRETHTYAAVAIAKSDGTEMEYRDFCISPLINGVEFSVANNVTLDTTLTFFKQDGVIYNLIECDNLEMFANRGVQLGVVDSFGSETRAFKMDEETGVYTKQEGYEKTNALFMLPLDKEKADDEAAEEYIEKLIAEVEEKEPEAEMDREMMKFSDFLNTITPENINEYFVRDENTVLTAVPDENGWIEFGSRYIEEEDYVINGASGYLTYMIEDNQDFGITSYGYGDGDLSDAQIQTIWRNSDGSFTTAAYHAKVDLSFVLE